MEHRRPILRDMWLGSAHRSPDKIALHFEGSEISYRQVVEYAQSLGKSFHAGGARHQSRVAVLAKNCLEAVYVYAACHIFGYISTPLNWRLSVPELNGILGDSLPDILVFEEEFTREVEGIRAEQASIQEYVCIGDNTPAWASSFTDALNLGGLPAVPYQAEADDIAHLLFTSGTTGKAKGVMRSQRADYRALQSIIAPLEFNHGGKTLVMMPMYHIGALFISYAQFLYEGTVVLLRAADPLAILHAIEKERTEVTFMAPTVIHDVLNVPEFHRFDVSSMRTIQYGAAPMTMPLLKEMREKMPSVGFVNTYGATEMSSVTFLYKNHHRDVDSALFEKHLSSVGQPYPDVDMRIIDDSGEDCALGEVGEVCVRTPTLMSGYWNNSEATIQAMPNGWYTTGDMGYLDEQSFLYLVDRKKDMIISGGENIYCREVEEALMAHGSLSDAAVIGVPDERWGESVRAIVIPKEGEHPTEEALISFCQSRIARYKRPKSIIFVSEFPRLPSGKTKKTELRARYGQL